jgi:hypothetical protein
MAPSKLVATDWIALLTMSKWLLHGLADNGGPTKTHALLTGSPAIDAGDPEAVAGVGTVPQFDQRGTGFPRVMNSRIDIGAFELALPGDYNRNGSVDAGDYVVWRKTLGTTGITAYSGADGDGDTIDQDDYNVWRTNFGNALSPPGAGSGAGDASSFQIQELGADAPAVRNIAADYMGESVVQIPMETISAPAETDAVSALLARFAAFETRSVWQGLGLPSHAKVDRYQAGESGDVLSLLLGIDRVRRSRRQDWLAIDDSGSDEHEINDFHNGSLIDQLLANRPVVDAILGRSGRCFAELAEAQ